MINAFTVEVLNYTLKESFSILNFLQIVKNYERYLTFKLKKLFKKVRFTVNYNYFLSLNILFSCCLVHKKLVK